MNRCGAFETSSGRQCVLETDHDGEHMVEGKEVMNELKARVDQFCQMELPGQLPAMHMGTWYLVNDLWLEVKALAAEVARLREGNAQLCGYDDYVEMRAALDESPA